ncbi:MAG: hypothetical protein SGPRY_011341 [Prymnesium sp.]
MRCGDICVVNSSELRAVQGRQECDFNLTPPKPPKPLRQQQARTKKQLRSESPPFDPEQRWRLDQDLDSNIRKVCEGT